MQSVSSSRGPNSDIRSVRCTTTFAAADILVQCIRIGVIAFGFMLYYNWLLALVALAMNALYRVGVRVCAKMMFPISW